MEGIRTTEKAIVILVCLVQGETVVDTGRLWGREIIVKLGLASQSEQRVVGTLPHISEERTCAVPIKPALGCLLQFTLVKNTSLADNICYKVRL